MTSLYCNPPWLLFSSPFSIWLPQVTLAVPYDNVGDNQGGFSADWMPFLIYTTNSVKALTEGNKSTSLNRLQN